MKRSVLVISLACWIFCVSPMAFGDEPQGGKEEYRKQTEAKLQGIRQDMKELQGKAVNLKDDARDAFNREMKELQKKQDEAQKKLKELSSATAQTWETIKAETDGAVNDLSRHFDRMMSRFRKQ